MLARTKKWNFKVQSDREQGTETHCLTGDKESRNEIQATWKRFFKKRTSNKKCSDNGQPGDEPYIHHEAFLYISCCATTEKEKYWQTSVPAMVGTIKKFYQVFLKLRLKMIDYLRFVIKISEFFFRSNLKFAMVKHLTTRSVLRFP